MSEWADGVNAELLRRENRIAELEAALDRIRRLPAAEGMTKGPADAFFEAVAIADAALSDHGSNSR